MYRFKSAKVQDISLPVRIANARIKRLSCQSRKSHFFSLLLGSRFSPRRNFSTVTRPGILVRNAGTSFQGRANYCGPKVRKARWLNGDTVERILAGYNQLSPQHNSAESPRVPPPLTPHENTTHFSAESRSCPR